LIDRSRTADGRDDDCDHGGDRQRLRQQNDGQDADLEQLGLRIGDRDDEAAAPASP
jgi:hypothetical protein